MLTLVGGRQSRIKLQDTQLALESWYQNSAFPLSNTFIYYFVFFLNFIGQY